METRHNWPIRKHWRCSFWRCAGYGLLGIIGFALIVILFGFIIMWLWNCILPQVFNFNTITYWQAVGIAVLARLIFGNLFPRGHHRGRRWGHSPHHCCGHNECKCDDHSNGHSHTHENKNGKCECDSSIWKYYDQFWEEEGEKAFHDYVKHKTGDSSKEDK